MNESTRQSLKRLRHKLSSQGVSLRPISQTAIEQFETDHNIRLPSQYRAFLTTVSDGCTASQGVIYKLTDTITPRARPAEPFPFSQYWVWEGDESVGPSEIARLDCGNLVLLDEGCGISWRIIVTGSERGQMWWFSGECIQPCAPRRNFLEWLEYWLDGGDDWWAEMYEDKVNIVELDGFDEWLAALNRGDRRVLNAYKYEFQHLIVSRDEINEHSVIGVLNRILDHYRSRYPTEYKLLKPWWKFW